MPSSITADDVRAARLRIRPLARKTPVLTSPDFDAEAGCSVFFKCENLQRGGAFKIRGASNLILSLPPGSARPRRGGVFVGEPRTGHGHRGAVRGRASHHRDAGRRAALEDGSHARAMAPASSPTTASPTAARPSPPRILKETGATLVPPFDHPLIMAGQGTAALELLEETGPLDALITPVGGGGLLSGCATIAKDFEPGIRIFGAEPEGANDTFLSMMAGERVDGAASGNHRRWPSFAATGRADVPDCETPCRAHCAGERRRDAGGREVPAAADEDPGGAERRVPVAAVLFRKLPADIRSVGVVISGGNIDFEELVKY